jgi:hypothetical protein
MQQLVFGEERTLGTAPALTHEERVFTSVAGAAFDEAWLLKPGACANSSNSMACAHQEMENLPVLASIGQCNNL